MLIGWKSIEFRVLLEYLLESRDGSLESVGSSKSPGGRDATVHDKSQWDSVPKMVDSRIYMFLEVTPFFKRKYALERHLERYLSSVWKSSIFFNVIKVFWLLPPRDHQPFWFGDTVKSLVKTEKGLISHLQMRKKR